MRRHAFLILAHGPAGQAADLVRALEHPAHSFFVHVDAKADRSSYVRSLQSEVHIVGERIDVWRKCWSMVQATEAVLGSALEDPRGFHWFTLLSAADYPLESAEAIADRYANNDAELVHFFRIADRPRWRARVDHRRYRDDAYRMSHADSYWRRAAIRNRLRMLRRVHRLRDQIAGGFRPPEGMELCGGSQWWSLQREAAEFVKRGLANPPLRRFFRYVDGPDELVVQTLLYNSRFREQLRGKQAYDEWLEGRRTQPPPEAIFNWRYVDWSESRHEIPPEGGSPRGPAILDERDVDVLLESDAVLARKFHIERSASLRRRLDERAGRTVRSRGPGEVE